MNQTPLFGAMDKLQRHHEAYMRRDVVRGRLLHIVGCHAQALSLEGTAVALHAREEFHAIQVWLRGDVSET